MLCEMWCCNDIPMVHMFSSWHNKHTRLGWVSNGSPSKLLTCMCSKDWSVTPSNHNQITWLMPCGKAEKQSFRMYLSLCQLLCSIWRYSSNTGQVQNMSMLLEVTVVYIHATSVNDYDSAMVEWLTLNWQFFSFVTGCWFKPKSFHPFCFLLMWSIYQSSFCQLHRDCMDDFKKKSSS